MFTKTEKKTNNKKLSNIPDKSNSPTTQRTVSMSDIRMPRVTSNGGGSNSGQQQQTLSPTTQQSQTQSATGSGGGGGSGTAAVASGVVGGGGGNNSQTTNTNNGANNGNSTIVTIKQESLGNVDNLVGSYVDSTTFLHSPGSQMVNPNLVQSNSGLSGIGAGENEILKQKIIIFIILILADQFYDFCPVYVVVQIFFYKRKIISLFSVTAIVSNNRSLRFSSCFIFSLAFESLSAEN